MLGATELQSGELSVLLCDDRTMRRLNRRYRKRDRPTDVLAFSMHEGESMTTTDLLGDVVISLDTARRQARRGDRSIIAEVTHLLAHGLLHLLGYDHQTSSQTREMDTLTGQLLRAVDGKSPAVDNRRGSRKIPRKK